MIAGSIFPVVLADEVDYIKGIDKGPSYRPVVPMKKVTFVNFDKDTYIDDYAFLAAIPTTVFSDGKRLFSNPLLFFQKENTYPDEDKYRFLNDYSGTNYLMEDWMSYCYGNLDKLTTINVNKKDLNSNWKTQTQTSINSEDPFEIASKLALDDWSYSDNAVLAVITKNFENTENTKLTGDINGEVSGEIGTDQIKVKRPFGSASEYEYFTVEDEYKYVKVDLWYPSFIWKSFILNMIPGFEGAPGITIPSVDPDFQIFCKFGDDWLQTSATSDMTITEGPHEQCFSYVYKSNDWRVGVTNMPTKGGTEYFIHYGPLRRTIRYGSFIEAIKNLIFGVKEFYVDITKYPGVEVEIPDNPITGCRDATFKLTWDNKDINLGLTIIGPSGEELDSVLKEDAESQEIKFHQLGECLEGEHYKAVVYALDDISSPVDFKIEYNWQQNITRKQADMIASACEGAVLGSVINAPLLYIRPDEAPKVTVETLNKLGVKQIYLIDLGGYLNEEVVNEISNSADIYKHYREYKDIYNAITEKTGSNDVVFSTIDPWSYWYYEDLPLDLKPAGEYDGAFHFGPAAYAAAHHGTPLLLVDNHPELSGAVTWHVDFWQKHASVDISTPPVACMFITGTKVYDFLREYGFDKQGPESILTVADQYDIGPTWTRVFAGVANPGAIIGTPVDESNHITRCVFYPSLIFQNPALQGKVTLINGSKSERVQRTLLRPFKRFLARLSPRTPGLSNLKILRKSGPEEYIYPVLHTFGTYSHRFNERGRKYWGVTYKTRTGYTPGEDLSGQEIDEGVMLEYSGRAGSFLPDLTDSENTAFYASRAGYSNAFSTNFDITMENLNKGIISWYMVLHGVHNSGGRLSWWQPLYETLNQGGVPSILAKPLSKTIGALLGANPVEINPWRGYDMLWGSTEEPDTATLDSELGIVLGWLGLANRNGPLNGGIIKPGLDMLPSNIPLLKFLGNRQNYHDGLVGPYGLTAMLVKFCYSHAATEVDDKLENIHSMSFHAGSCLIGTRYLQIALMRHGSVLQEADPWSTSYWAGYVGQQVARDYALGKTVGETYAEAITTVGVKYLFEKNEERMWWWDTAENVVLFADPDLRIWVPSTEYDVQARNHWEKQDIKALRYDAEISIDGHMLYGATSYPNEKRPETFWDQYLWLIIILVLIVILLIAALTLTRKKK